MRFWRNLFSVGCALWATACSQSRVSERDIRRQQQQTQNALKRQELESVAGHYVGVLKNDAVSAFEQFVVLHLESKDVPQAGETVDPTLIPKLVGFLRFQFGDEESLEYIDAPFTQAEYLPDQALLNAEATHPQFEKMILALRFENQHLSGTWAAPSVGATGTLEVTRRSSQP